MKLSAAFKTIGVVFTIACIWFIALSLSQTYKSIPRELFSVRFGALIVALSFTAALANQALGLAWYSLLRGASAQTPLPLSRALAIFNQTQLYKYLPGNVFHMVGRYAIANKEGAPHAPLLFAQSMEVVLVICAASIVAVAGGRETLIGELQQHGYSGLAVGGIAGAMLALPTAAIVAWRLHLMPVSIVPAALRSLLLYGLFFFAGGLLAVILARRVGVGSTISSGNIVSIAATAWLLGFVLPGAPGGLGPRDAVMIAGLTAIGVPSSTATVISLCHRIVMTGGDCLSALFGHVFRRGTEQPG